MKIKDLPDEDRPREKLRLKGSGSLSDAELLAILLGTGITGINVIALSHNILKMADNNLNELGKKTIQDFKTIQGIGEAKAISIIAALELGRRRKLAESLERKTISGSTDAFAVLQPLIADLPIEQFWCLFLNKANKVLAIEKMFSGGVDSTVVDVRVIIKRALELNATSMIVSHNHPSGNLNPSQHDIVITKKIFEAGKILDIKLLDHLIIANTKFYSFADNELWFQ